MDRDEALVSYVIPCYRSARTISHLVCEIEETWRAHEECARFRFEIILVCDASPDDTLFVIRRLCETHEEITGISLNVNVGQHAAIMAGLRHAKGGRIICLDDDLQTPPAESIKLLNKLEEGYDVVYAFYPHKRHSAIRNLFTYLNRYSQEFFFRKPKGIRTSSFFIMRGRVADKVLRYKGPKPYLAALILRVTKNIASIPVRHRARTEGRSTYNIPRLFAFWWNGVFRFAVRPAMVMRALRRLFPNPPFLNGQFFQEPEETVFHKKTDCNDQNDTGKKPGGIHKGPAV